MRLKSCVAVPLLMSAAFASSVAAQDLDGVSYDLVGAEEYGYCEPVSLATPTTTEYFNLVGCEDGFMAQELLDTAPRVNADFVMPTEEQYKAGDAFARCVFESLPNAGKLDGDFEDIVFIGQYTIPKQDLESLKRIAAYECGMTS